MESWDVSAAVLYAPLIEKRDIYCRPPQVLVKLGLAQPGIVWKSKKALYLRTSPRAWEEVKRVNATNCVWTIQNLDDNSVSGDYFRTIKVVSGQGCLR